MASSSSSPQTVLNDNRIALVHCMVYEFLFTRNQFFNPTVAQQIIDDQTLQFAEFADSTFIDQQVDRQDESSIAEAINERGFIVIIIIIIEE